MAQAVLLKHLSVLAFKRYIINLTLAYSKVVAGFEPANFRGRRCESVAVPQL
jgi:hypothetical protein